MRQFAQHTHIQFMQKITPKKLRQALIGALTFSTLTGCAVSVSRGDKNAVADELSIARTIETLAPDTARYTTQTFDWQDVRAIVPSRRGCIYPRGKRVPVIHCRW